MTVVLYRVGRSLNRAYRTAACFGAIEMLLWECSGTLRGGLYSAAGAVRVTSVEGPPAGAGVGLSARRGVEIAQIDWGGVEWIAVGGETDGLPASLVCRWARIETEHSLCLTTEAAVAIALREWRVARKE